MITLGLSIRKARKWLGRTCPPPSSFPPPPPPPWARGLFLPEAASWLYKPPPPVIYVYHFWWMKGWGQQRLIPLSYLPASSPRGGPFRKAAYAWTEVDNSSNSFIISAPFLFFLFVRMWSALLMKGNDDLDDIGVPGWCWFLMLVLLVLVRNESNDDDWDCDDADAIATAAISDDVRKSWFGCMDTPRLRHTHTEQDRSHHEKH